MPSSLKEQKRQCEKTKEKNGSSIYFTASCAIEGMDILLSLKKSKYFKLY